MPGIVLIAHNVRSTHNVGSLLRTADGLGVTKVFLTGYTPYPLLANDDRLPHLADKLNKQIAKTSLGAEESVDWEHQYGIEAVISSLKQQGYAIYAIEQSDEALILPDFKSPPKIVLIVGREVEGIEKAVLSQCDGVLEIPMLGKKESYNVASAAAMALYHCRFVS